MGLPVDPDRLGNRAEIYRAPRALGAPPSGRARALGARTNRRTFEILLLFVRVVWAPAKRPSPAAVDDPVRLSPSALGAQGGP